MHTSKGLATKKVVRPLGVFSVFSADSAFLLFNIYNIPSRYQHSLQNIRYEMVIVRGYIIPK